MSTDTALAVTPQNHDEPAALQMARQTQMIPTTATILDRANLQFFADMIEAAELIPYDKNISKAVQKARVMSKIVSGVAHEFDPVSAQENLHVIQGRCVLSARGMSVKMARLGFSTRVEQLDDNGCKLAVLREMDGKFTLLGYSEFTYQQAVNAKLTTSNATMYDKWRPDMLYANALKRAARRYCPQALDTTPVLYDTAKRPQPPADPTPPPAPNQLNTGASAPAPEPQVTPAEANAETPIGGEYVDPEYTGGLSAAEEAALDSELIDAEVVNADVTDEPPASEPVDPEESKYQDLLTTAKELYTELKGPEKKKADAFIGSGNLLKDLDAERLAEFLEAFSQ